MAIIAVPPELMTPTAAGLLEAAAALGLPASVVATNSDTPLGIGFVWASWRGSAFEVS